MLNNLEQGGGGGGMETNEEVKKYLWYLQEDLHIKFIFEGKEGNDSLLMIGGGGGGGSLDTEIS